MHGRSRRRGRAGREARLGTLALSLCLAAWGAFPRAVRATEVVKVASAPARPTAVSPAALERTHGIRITRVAVTAGGGLVDLRFTVVDPAKARPLLQDHAGPPRLLVEGGGAELQAPAHGAMRNVRLQKDAACFLLFPNARSAIEPGTRVAIAFGTVTVEPVVAE